MIEPRTQTGQSSGSIAVAVAVVVAVVVADGECPATATATTTTTYTTTTFRGYRGIGETSHCVRPDAMYDRAMKPRIYVDTSVIGGCEDDEFAEHSVRLMECFARGDFVLVLSTLTLGELAAAPDHVREHLARVPEVHIETVQLDSEAMDLADAYTAAGVIVPKMRVDAQHIAMATVARVDVLVSWNFKHIVNLQRIHGYNSINLRRGYPTLEIRSPREVLSDD